MVRAKTVVPTGLTCRLVFLPEKHREENVRDEQTQKGNPDHPEERTKAVQFCAVGVEHVGTEEDRQVAEQMPGHEGDKRNTGEGDDGFFSDG
jgi:hypothetical protein